MHLLILQFIPNRYRYGYDMDFFRPYKRVLVILHKEKLPSYIVCTNLFVNAKLIFTKQTNCAIINTNEQTTVPSGMSGMTVQLHGVLRRRSELYGRL